MKNIRKIIFMGSFLILLVIVAGCTAEQPEIGILDMEKVLDESKRAQELKNKLVEVSENLEKNYKEKEKKLNGEKKDEELDNIYMEFLDNKQKYEGQLNKEIKSILAEVSDSKNLEIVLYKKYVKYGGTDITSGVIEKLDNKYAKGGNTDNGTGE